MFCFECGNKNKIIFKLFRNYLYAILQPLSIQTLSPNVNNAIVALSNGLFVDNSGFVSGWQLTGNAVSSGKFLGTTNS